MNQLSEKEVLKNNIKYCFYKWIIHDPYPEITNYEIEQSILSNLGKIFRFHKENNEPKISVHKAWMDGYEFAKKLVIDELDKN